jgi:hypothetical protein
MPGVQEILRKARCGAKAKASATAAAPSKRGKGRGKKDTKESKEEAREGAAGGAHSANNQGLIRDLMKTNGLLTLNLAGRMRAVESVVMTVFLVKSEANFLDSMAEVSREHHKAVMASKDKSSSERYTPEAPVHVMCWAAAVAVWMDEISMDTEELSEYNSGMESDWSAVADEVLYFRKVTCHKAELTKLMVSFKYGSAAENIFRKVIQPHLFELYGSTPLRGMAPKSGNERKMERILVQNGLIYNKKKGRIEMVKDKGMSESEDDEAPLRYGPY